jgi:hypothetical protein
MVRAIRDWNVDFIFHDCFVSPQIYWDRFDPPGQKGITQINYIEGRHELWRRLNAELPELLILVGLTPDLETMRNTHLAMMGRHTGDGSYNAFELSAVNRFYPAVYCQNDFIKYQDSYDEPYPLFAWLSRFAAMLGIGDPIRVWSPRVTAQAKEAIQVYKSIRHLLKGDFYLLLPQSRSLENWTGWQFHNPLTGEGFAVLFRLRYCEMPTCSVPLRALQADVPYEFNDPFSGHKFTAQGRQLLEEGLTARLPKNGAQLLHYAPVAKKLGR